jgi:transcriptional regulator with XRE-family HTH domain
MATRRRTSGRRTALQIAADRRAGELARSLGRALRDARTSGHLRQVDVGARAQVGTSTVSALERGALVDATILVWTRVARAAGSDLRAYLERTTAADQPRDAVHLRHQELVARTAAAGGWRVLPEALLDADATRSRAADLVLARGNEVVLVEVWDWLDDVGAAFRSFDRRLATVDRRSAARGEAGVRVAGLWVLRATRRNRHLVADHATLFRARFAGSGTSALRSLGSPQQPIPAESALIWVTPSGERLFPARIGGAP